MKRGMESDRTDHATIISSIHFVSQKERRVIVGGIRSVIHVNFDLYYNLRCFKSHKIQSGLCNNESVIPIFRSLTSFPPSFFSIIACLDKLHL